MLNSAFKSELYRLQLVKDLRSGNIPVFESLHMIPHSPLLEFKVQPQFAAGVQVEEIYKRDETHTVIYQVTLANAVKLVMKVYQIPRKHLVVTDKTAANHQIEIRYLKLFTDMVQRLECPHFTLPIGHAIVTETDVHSLLGTTVKEGSYMILLGEWADSTFNRLLREGITDESIRGIIFQTVLTLHIIHDRFPSFRHNDLHLSNVLIQEFDKAALKTASDSQDKALCVKYTVNQKKYYLNLLECPYRVLLWDMYFSSIDSVDADKYKLPLVVPSKTELFPSKDKNQNRVCLNQYFDLHKFFDSLHYVLSLNKKRPVSVELQQLIDLVVPDHLKCMSKNLTHQDKTDMRLWECKHITPLEVLQQPYFHCFGVPSPQRVIIREYTYPRSIQ
jgi:hypothetical protein